MIDRNEDTETMFDMKIEDIKESVHTTRVNLGKMRHFQFMHSADMSKVCIIVLCWTCGLVITGLSLQDTHQVASNLDTINFWSVVHLAMLFVVGFTQVGAKLATYL